MRFRWNASSITAVVMTTNKIACTVCVRDSETMSEKELFKGWERMKGATYRMAKRANPRGATKKRVTIFGRLGIRLD